MTTPTRLYMETTSIAPEQTIGEITRLLVAKGASAVASRYAQGIIKSVTFQYPVGERLLAYELPCHAEGVFRYLQQARRPSLRAKHQAKDAAQAARIAWRIQLRCVQAQIAMIDTAQAKMEEVFLPYLLLNGETLYHRLAATQFRLPALTDQR